MRPVTFSRHALAQMPDRGVSREEVEEAIRFGERVAAKRGLVALRKNFQFRSDWKGRYYEVKQVMPIVAEESGRIVVVTVYAFYFGSKQ
jgi:hypothetical protein